MKKIFWLLCLSLYLLPGSAFAQGNIDELVLKSISWKYEESYVEEAIEDEEIAGTHVYGEYALPESFSFRAQLRIFPETDPRNREKWRHVIELGAPEYGWNCPFRLEVGDEGEWYVAVGDGNSYSDLTVNGGWTYNTDIYLLFTFENGVGKLYQNGVLIGELNTNLNISGISGTLITGSNKGAGRFLEAFTPNIEFQSGVLCAYRPPTRAELNSKMVAASQWIRNKKKLNPQLIEQNKLNEKGLWTICVDDYPIGY